MRFLLLLFFLQSCGTEEFSNLDIINGHTTYRSWFVKLNGCGGMLIAPDTVLTAKHCSHQLNFKAKIGLYRKGDPDNGGKRKIEEIRVVRAIKHASWDLQILKLERRSTFQPIKLFTGKLEKGQRLAAFGFGNTIGGVSSAPEYLQGAVFFYEKEGTRPGIIRASNRPNVAVCHGDSGGPLVFNGRLVATVTFTEGNCSIYGSMGFTKLDYNWIKKYI
jgi:secreted trypsin-like serine protease